MLENIEEAINECVLIWTHMVEAQRSALNKIKESKDFDAIFQNTQKWVHVALHSD